MACDRLRARHHQALPGSVSGKPCATYPVQEPGSEEDAYQTSTQMKLDKSLSDPNWRNALLKIVGKTRKNLEPVIVAKQDIPLQAFRIQRFFISIGATYTRLGVSCSLLDSLTELLRRMAGESLKREPRDIDEVISSIIKRATAFDQKVSFVIDNCNCLSPGQLFYLLGLVIELRNKVQFWFLFSANTLPKWRYKNSKDKRTQFFVKTILLRYDIGF